MAQKIFTDCGRLIDSGKTAEEYQEQPDWNAAIHDTVDTGQTFDLSTRQMWFYFPTLGLFFESTEKQHAIFAAAKTLFTATRWKEIEDILDSQGAIREMIARFDLTLARRKIARARAQGLITAIETTALANLVAHLPNGGSV